MDIVDELLAQANMRGLAGDAEFRAAHEIKRLRAAIAWALGEGDSDFESPPGNPPRYWWRRKLRDLARGEPTK